MPVILAANINGVNSNLAEIIPQNLYEEILRFIDAVGKNLSESKEFQALINRYNQIKDPGHSAETYKKIMQRVETAFNTELSALKKQNKPAANFISKLFSIRTTCYMSAKGSMVLSTERSLKQLIVNSACESVISTKEKGIFREFTKSAKGIVNHNLPKIARNKSTMAAFGNLVGSHTTAAVKKTASGKVIAKASPVLKGAGNVLKLAGEIGEKAIPILMLHDFLFGMALPAGSESEDLSVSSLFSKTEFSEASTWYAKLNDPYFKNHHSFDELICLYNCLPDGFYKNYILKLHMKPGEEKYRLKIVLNEIYKDIKKYGNFKQSRFMVRFMKEYKFFPKK